MKQEELKKVFREAELKNRQARRAALLQSEAALESEVVREEGKVACKEALESIKRQEIAFLRGTGRGYWEMLWLALRGKL